MFNIILPKFTFKIEKWKFNKDYRVYVSNMGNFKNEYKQEIPKRINQSGYVVIKTATGMKVAHRLVMLTWKPIPDAESLTVDHLNSNKRDNSVLNLEWVTLEENQKRARETMLTGIEKKRNKDLENSNTKLRAILENGEVEEYRSFQEAKDVMQRLYGGVASVPKKDFCRTIEKSIDFGGKKYLRKWERI